jgi:HSP20 family protein
MAIRDLVPKFRNGRSNVAVRRNDWDPFRDFQREINRMFDEFIGDFPALSGWKGRSGEVAAFSPAVDISETDKVVKISAELPGMDEDNISVEMDNSTVTICGEKSEEKEDKNSKWHVREQSYGSFQRVIPLPAGVDSSKAKAKFKKGVLTVTLPKLEDEQGSRRTVKIENG